MSSSSKGATPGGPSVSSVKKRRLAALEQAHGSKAAAVNDKPMGAKTHTPSKTAASTITKEASASTTSTPQATFPYNRLLPHELPKASGKEAGSRGAGCEVFLEGLLAAAGVADAAKLLRSRVLSQTLLLDNPSKQPNASAAMARRDGAPAHAALLSTRARKARKQGSAELLRGLKYQEHMVPLHERWQQYMAEVLDNQPALEECVLQAEMVGGHIHVQNCQQKHLQGINGIVALRTQQAFHVITADDRHRVVPLQGCIMRLTLGSGRSAVLIGTNLLAAWKRQQPAHAVQLTTSDVAALAATL